MSGASCNKAPPIWSQDKAYKNWKSELDLWLVVTDLEKKKRAPSKVLSLQGRQLEVARELPLEKLHHDEVVSKLLEKLNGGFWKNSVDSEIDAYVKLIDLSSKFEQKCWITCLHLNLPIDLPESVLQLIFQSQCKLANCYMGQTCSKSSAKQFQQQRRSSVSKL